MIKEYNIPPALELESWQDNVGSNRIGSSPSLVLLGVATSNGACNVSTHEPSAKVKISRAIIISHHITMILHLLSTGLCSSFEEGISRQTETFADDDIPISDVRLFAERLTFSKIERRRLD